MSKFVTHALWFVALAGSVVWAVIAPEGEFWPAIVLSVTLVICWSSWALIDARARHTAAVSDVDRVDPRPPHERIPVPHPVGR